MMGQRLPPPRQSQATASLGPNTVAYPLPTQAERDRELQRRCEAVLHAPLVEGPRGVDPYRVARVLVRLGVENMDHGELHKLITGKRPRWAHGGTCIVDGLIMETVYR